MGQASSGCCQNKDATISDGSILYEDREDFSNMLFKWDSCEQRFPIPTCCKFDVAQILEPTDVAQLSELRQDPDQFSLSPLSLATDQQIFDISLHDSGETKSQVNRYYELCKRYTGVHATTSCFTIWRKNKKSNGHAKVIPAVPVADRDNTCVFFFDDNVEWDGRAESGGICNLRHVRSGEFVDFCDGSNGFCRSTAARHTVVLHSTQYRNVLVKANILDAMEDPEYFSRIIKRYAWPGEKLIIFMDVNSTIVCTDTVQGKDLNNTLLSTIYEFVELRPRAAFELAFDSHPPINIDNKPKTLKQLVKELTSDNREAYGSFWTEDRCWRFFAEVAAKGEVFWSGRDGPFSLAACKQLFEEYLVTLSQVINRDGIAGSWFEVYERLRSQGQHTLILNSFGVDTRKVLLATLPSENEVLQVTVNYDMWDDRDKQKFAAQFKS